MNETKAIFVAAVRSAIDLPAEIRTAAEKVVGLSQTTLDQSYLDFLDEQIRLCPRGEEWNAILKRRRNVLAPFVGRQLVGGEIPTSRGQAWVKVDPLAKRVLYWEE